MATEEYEGQRTEAAGYFGPASVIWRVAGEAALVLGGGRAVLLQLAHPLVAAGVGAHSSYTRDPWQRFQDTLQLTQALVFGTRAEARAAARTINRLHVHVRGSLDAAAGPYPAGAAYRAQAPDLLLWVLATLIDTALQVYPLLVGPLSRAEQERYYQEERASAILLGLPASAIPATLDAFDAYMRGMLAGDVLAVTPEARRVAHAVMHFTAPFPWWPTLWPARALMSQLTIALLPDQLRAAYGLTWQPWQDACLARELAALRLALPLLPPAVRYLPLARAARRRIA